MTPKVNEIVTYLQNRVLDQINSLFYNVKENYEKGIVNNNDPAAVKVEISIRDSIMPLITDVFNLIRSIFDDVKIRDNYIEYFTTSKFETIEELTVSFMGYYKEKLNNLTTALDIEKCDVRLRSCVIMYSKILQAWMNELEQRFLEQVKDLNMKYVNQYQDLLTSTGWIFLDIESVGIQGESFAFAYEVVNLNHEVIDKGFYYYHPSKALGKKEDRKWIMTNCFPTFDDPKYIDLKIEVPGIHELCDKFREVWQKYHKGYVIVADCPFPCESNFLTACNLDPSPMPIFDLATMLFMVGKSPTKTYERLPEELPSHNPYADIQQTKRMFFQITSGNADLIK